MSWSRPFVSARCSSKISLGVSYGKRSGAWGLTRRCSRRPISVAMRQSGSAFPGGGTAARTREMRRSEFVTVPSFSPQVAAGSSTSAKATVSVSAKASCTTTSSACRSAWRTASMRGRECAGLVQAIQTALTLPSAKASNMSTAARPGRSDSASTFQKAATSARCASLSMSRCAASMVAMPPTSRPPMALGWPVSEKGPAPGRPICPVAKCRLISARFLSVPWLDWFRPMQ